MEITSCRYMSRLNFLGFHCFPFSHSSWFCLAIIRVLFFFKFFYLIFFFTHTGLSLPLFPLFVFLFSLLFILDLLMFLFFFLPDFTSQKASFVLGANKRMSASQMNYPHQCVDLSSENIGPCSGRLKYSYILTLHSCRQAFP